MIWKHDFMCKHVYQAQMPEFLVSAHAALCGRLHSPSLAISWGDEERERNQRINNSFWGISNCVGCLRPLFPPFLCLHTSRTRGDDLVPCWATSGFGKRDQGGCSDNNSLPPACLSTLRVSHSPSRLFPYVSIAVSVCLFSLSFSLGVQAKFPF